MTHYLNEAIGMGSNQPWFGGRQRDAVGAVTDKAKLTRLWAVFFFSKLSFLSMKVALLSFTKLRFWTSSSTRFWISEMLMTGGGTCKRNSVVFSDTRSHWALTLPGWWWWRAWKTVPQRENLGNLRASIKMGDLVFLKPHNMVWILILLKFQDSIGEQDTKGARKTQE